MITKENISEVMQDLLDASDKKKRETRLKHSIPLQEPKIMFNRIGGDIGKIWGNRGGITISKDDVKALEDFFEQRRREELAKDIEILAKKLKHEQEKIKHKQKREKNFTFGSYTYRKNKFK